ncbi:hypothetical protein Sango_0730400 [Sesamum angolense]|uniref:PPPDE domain-containing protein n=1 Tax=Sesamum angolense TaxID=2727404 RepID=A0AAE1X299_9LAMI|nr:hypothetical protein Sango_0730400 [Sesamum angolense]
MTEVTLHIYDVTNSGNEKTNNTIMQINKIFKDGIGLGGIFHSAVQASVLLVTYGKFLCLHFESYCRHSVLICAPLTLAGSICPGRHLCVLINLSIIGGGWRTLILAWRLTLGLELDDEFGAISLLLMHFAYPVHKFMEMKNGHLGSVNRVLGCLAVRQQRIQCIHTVKALNLGKTSFSIYKVNQILRELSREWPGHSYDLLSKNCNHFCDEFCERLGVPKLPGWVNRFAHAGDAAAEIAGNTAYRLRQAKTEIISASKVAYRFLAGVASNNSVVAPESPGDSTRGSPRFQTTWFRNLISNGAKPSNSSETENKNEEAAHQQQRQDNEAPLRLSPHRDI